MIDHPVYIDGILKQWGDQLFCEPVHAKRVRRPYRVGRKQPTGDTSAKSGSGGGAARTRRMLALTAKRTPEVMVKISKARKGSIAVKSHLDYISRNGKLALEDQDEQKIKGRETIRDFLEEWKAAGRIKEPSENRDAFSIILSMPAGTDRDAVTKAAREFAKAEFAKKHRYVFVPHHDEKHSHVHLCVLSLGRNGIRLNPRKADLQRWREGFAEKLRENGIEANATKRNVRGYSKKAVKQPVIHIDKRGESVVLKEQRKAVAEELTTGNKQPNPHREKMKTTRGTVQTAYSEIISALRQSSDPKDRVLAKDVSNFVDSMKPLETKREEAVRLYKESKNKEQSKDKGPER
jgi:hypothetical protein